MSEADTPAPGTATLTPPSSDYVSSPVDRAWDAFEKAETAKDAKPAATPAASVHAAEPKAAAPNPANPATLATPAAAAPSPRKVKYQFNHEDAELDIDDAVKQLEEWAKDPTKPHPFVDIVQKGRAFDKATTRRYEEGMKSLAAHLNKLGVQIKAKTQNAQTFDDYDFTFPGVAMPQAKSAADDPLAKEIAALEAKALDGTATAEDLMKLPRLERQREAAQQKSEADRKAQEAQREQTRVQTENAVDDALTTTIEARAKSFEGVEKDTADRVRSIVWALARQTALANGQGADGAKANVNALLNHIEGYTMARIKHLTATAQPPAAPVLGGTPTGGAPAASKGRASMQNESWLDDALENSSARR